MSIATSPPRLPDSPRAMKRQKLDHEEQPVASSSTSPSETEAERVEREMNSPIEFVKTYDYELDYRNKLVLAPMVRTGSCKLSHVSIECSAAADRMQCRW